MPLKVKDNEAADLGHLFYVEEMLPVSLKQIARETKNDTLLNQVLGFTRFGWPKKLTSEEVRQYFFRREQIHIEHGCLLWGFRVIVLKKLQGAILNEIHASHMGINRCKSIARMYGGQILMIK